VNVECLRCQHEATVNVDALPDDLPVPDVALRLRCSACGSKRIMTRPNWLEERHRSATAGLIDATMDADAADERRYQQLAAERPEEGGDETLHRAVPPPSRSPVRRPLFGGGLRRCSALGARLCSYTRGSRGVRGLDRAGGT
jgi:hypothetical protein